MVKYKGERGEMMKKASMIFRILLGNFCVAVGTVFFVVPAGFITGGATGIALLLEEYFFLPISYGIAIISLALLGIGWIFLGKKFAANTAISAISYPLFVWICEWVAKFADVSTDSTVINLSFAVLLYGYGIAMVMRQGASTGGLDTIALILYEKKGVSLAVSVAVLEVLSMATQVIYSSTEEILGGILLTVFYTAVMNHFIARGTARVQVMIYSKQYEQINCYIDTVLHRGSTLFRAQGGHKREDTFVLQTIVSYRELFRLKEAVLQTDPLAFMTVSEMSQVSGKGFTLDSDVPGDKRKGNGN